MDSSMFGGFVVNAQWQIAFVIVKLAILWRNGMGLYYWYASRSSLVRIVVTLNSAHYISGMLRTVPLPFIQDRLNPSFQQDNALPHVAGFERTFLDK
ncbi:hypothetical protein TNCV_2703521 [Trichonephila clavipes]|nr:hypothetical protein TNCV_2703521 [Trichonephila clavipes]